MVDFISIVPKLQGVMGTIGVFILVIVIMVAISGITFGISYYVIMKRNFNCKAIIFERISGHFQPVRTEPSGHIKISKEGTMAFFLRKSKVWLPTPTIQTGPRIYWFARKGDGSLVNIGLEDLDEKAKEMHIHFTNADMRYETVAIRKNLDHRFNKVGFWEKYGTMIIIIIMVVIVLVLLFLIFKEFVTFAGTMSSTQTAIAETVKNQDRILESLNNIYNTVNNPGSGIITVE